MPSKKGRRMAARQTQMRPRHKASHPQLTEAQLRGPDEQAVEGAPAPELPSQPQEREAMRGAAATALAPSASPRVRREQQVISLQAGPSMRAELLRIGILTFVVALMVVVLRLTTDLGT